MDSATLIALLVGAAISLISSLAATVGAGWFKEWRGEKRKQREAEDAQLRSLQQHIIDVGAKLDALGRARHMPPLIPQSEILQMTTSIENEVRAAAGQVVVEASRIHNDEVRTIISPIRQVINQLAVTPGSVEGKRSGEFQSTSIKVSDALGELISRRDR